MRRRTEIGPRTFGAGAALAFAIGGLLLHTWLAFDGIVPRAALETARGRVAWVTAKKHIVEFGLEGETTAFDYTSKSGEMRRVRDELLRPDRPLVHLRFDPRDPRTPPFSSDRFFGVFELEVDGRMVRSHDDIARAWASDQAIAGWLGGSRCWVALASRGAR